MDIKKRYNREEKKSGYKEKIKREDIKVNRKQHIIMLNAANYYGTIFTMKISR